MASEDGQNVPRDRALAALDHFLQRLLPYHLRRSSRWRHACPELRRQLAVELQQELTLDCLLCAAEIDAMPMREQNRRWFQRTDRWLYYERIAGRALEVVPAATTTGGFASAAEAESEQLAEQVEAPLPEAHGTTSRSVTAFAARIGASRKKARATWAKTARSLGFGPDYFAFWRQRLAEALTGLAADLLLDARVMVTLPRKRRAPDPSGRRRRIRCILKMLAVAPIASELALPIAHAKVRRKMRAVTPATLLEAAEKLDPWNPAIPLWRFEAAVVERDFRAASHALRRARLRTLDPVAVALSRARLLAVRGRAGAALRLLQRGAARRPDDARLRTALHTSQQALANLAV